MVTQWRLDILMSTNLSRLFSLELALICLLWSVAMPTHSSSLTFCWIDLRHIASSQVTQGTSVSP